MKHVVEAKDLRRVYEVRRGMFKEPAHLQAVGGISFAIDAGRTLAVVGESGCGKSTLARVVALIEKPSGGQLELAGSDAVNVKPAHSASCARPCRWCSRIRTDRSIRARRSAPILEGAARRSTPSSARRRAVSGRARCSLRSA